jgi:hypothetical protein
VNTKDRAIDSPRDMPPIQYAGWLCENRLAIPKSKSLLEIIELAIKSIAASKYRDEKWKHPEFSAFCWLDKQCEIAKIRGEKINQLWFMNGSYNEVEPLERKLPPFIPCKECDFGWKRVVGGVISCECRKAWIESARSK